MSKFAIFPLVWEIFEKMPYNGILRDFSNLNPFISYVLI